MSNKVVVGRPINGISLNGYEWLLDGPEEEGGSEVTFENKEDAKQFLIDAGADEDDIEDEFVFKFIDENGEILNDVEP